MTFRSEWVFPFHDSCVCALTFLSEGITSKTSKVMQERSQDETNEQSVMGFLANHLWYENQYIKTFLTSAFLKNGKSTSWFFVAYVNFQIY